MKIKIEFEGRLDQVLSNQLNFSRSKISQIIKEGILLNSKKIDKPSTKVKIGDLVEFEYTEVDLSKITPVKIDFNILYEDEYLMVVNKPRGLVVHPSSGHYQDSLANGLAYYFNKDNESMDDEFRMGIVHRIDKDTSGLLIVAKTLLAKQKLSEMISKHLVDRQYFALAYGFFSNKKFKVDAPIGRDKSNRLKMAVTDDGRPSVTHFKLIRQFNGAGLLSCQLETGRTHQIRVHLSYIKHPIVGDELYTNRKCDFANCGQLLHAYKIKFIHPFTNKEMVFYADLDDYFKKAIVKFGLAI